MPAETDVVKDTEDEKDDQSQKEVDKCLDVFGEKKEYLLAF